MKGLNFRKEKFKPIVKAYPLSYSELEQLFFGVCLGGNFIKPFIKMRFICMLILSYTMGLFLHYLETVALMHTTQNTTQDFLFPNVTVKKNVVTLCDTQVTYNAFLNKLQIGPVLS